MKTEELIVQLAGSARPIARVRPPTARLGLWLAWAVTIAGAAILVVGPRADFVSAIEAPAYVVSLALLILTAVGAAAASLALAVPGAGRSWVRWISIAGGAGWPLVWSTSMVASPVSTAIDPQLFHAACAIEIIVLSLLGGLLLFTMIARGAPLRTSWAALTASVAMLASAAAATQVICPIGDPAHQLVSHVLVGVLVGMGGTLTGRRLLRL